MMKSLSRVGLGLSVVFTCLLLALIAEIYYLLWWKRRIIRREIEVDHNNPAREFFLYIFCWKKKAKLSTLSSIVNPSYNAAAPQTHYQEFQFPTQAGNNNTKDYMVMPLDEDDDLLEPGMFLGPPRFLFTIKEETKEDLDLAEEGKVKERSSLSELMKSMETPPYLTPLSSPHHFVTPPITPIGSCTHSSQNGCGNIISVYNPFHEASSDAEFNKLVKSSPPPKFKFLRDAEEKLQRKQMLIDNVKVKEEMYSQCDEDIKDKDGTFINIIVANPYEGDKSNHHYHSPVVASSSTPPPCFGTSL